MEVSLTNDSIHFREVWSDNLDQEFRLIRDIVDAYPYVSVDTEYPGTVVEPISWENREYENMKTNVNLTKLIQVGFTFSDENGNLPTCGTDKYCVWQFNFCEFVLDRDLCAKASINLLRRSGIDFMKNNEKGVSCISFAELLMSSGAVLNDEVHWITFHGSCDFAYLLKLLTGKNLPDTEAGFFELIRIYFPKLYDIKYLMGLRRVEGGLSTISSILGVQRIGTSHLAGSDSLLTCCTFMKFRELLGISQEQVGILHGLGVGRLRR
ncbi:probable CCR4-associated factor 1 homolog 7 [Humulus lupulus]|uniref:probable CCR4-associated factor 1 homolog 7 n=1 Tax=Humulus lupulus TaxID=3486 RepID=UPI002B408BE9|nr:probable CCR4-associated factor 1 homolog 7 [Humulus lupulus]